jgi:DNA-directed RNA polymerase specialized sigma24 family protein
VTAALSPAPSEEAKAAIERMRIAQEALDAARIERDRAIHRMRHIDGMSPPQIARALGLSISLIRVTLRMPEP